MIHPDGLSHADLRAWRRALRNPAQTAQWHIRLTDLDGNHRSSLTTHTLSGQVLGDLHHFGDKYGPTRKLMLSVLDPNNTLDVSPKSSAAAQSLYLSTLVHVTHVIRVDELGEHVHCPLFVGRPTDDLDRTGSTVQINAADKAVLGMGQAWKPLHIPRHTPKVDAIQRILSERVGETRFAFPQGKSKPILRSINLGRMHSPWAVATRIAESMDYQLYYRADGVCVLRPWPRRPLYTFDAEQEIVGEVQARTSLVGFDDLVEVLGHRPHGSKHRIRAVARPGKDEPFSPESLAFHGTPAFMVRREKHPHMRSVQEAQKRADRALEDHQDAIAGEVTLDTIPLPFIEEGDKYRAVTNDGDHATFRLRSFTLPIGVGDSGGAPAMNINYHEKPPEMHHKPRRHHKAGRHHRGA